MEKKLGTRDSGGEIRTRGEKVSVCDGGGVEAEEVPTRSPVPIRLRDHVKRTGPGLEGPADNACLLHIDGLGGGDLVWG